MNIIDNIDTLSQLWVKLYELILTIQCSCAFINYTKITCFMVKMYQIKIIYVLFLKVIENDWKLNLE